MSTTFIEGQHYICKTLLKVPIFEHNPTGEQIIMEHGIPEETYIIDSNNPDLKYKYRRHIVDFKENRSYFCVSAYPLILRGEMAYPFALQNRGFCNLLEEYLAEQWKELNLQLNVPTHLASTMSEARAETTAEILTRILEPEISFGYDSSQESFINVMNDVLQSYTEKYMGPEPYRDKEELKCRTILITMYRRQVADAWFYLWQNDALPEGFAIDISEAFEPTVNGEPFFEWLKGVMVPTHLSE